MSGDIVTEPDITVSTLWQWECWTCRNPDESNMPGAYGGGETFAKVSAAISDHKRTKHGATP